MKKFIFQAVLLLIITVGGLLIYFKDFRLSGVPFVPEQSVVKEISLGGNKFTVEVADTQAKRSKGLSEKLTLGPNEGMLFIFDKRGKYPFWMKGLTYPLDFIWIRDNKIVDMLFNVQPPQSGQEDSSLPIFQSSEEVDQVLELPGGSINKFNIKVGDTVTIN